MNMLATGRSRSSCPLGCSGPVRDLGSRNGFQVVRCSRCRHLFTTNLPSDDALDAIYSLYSYKKRGLKSMSKFIFTRMDEILSRFDPYRSTNRLLDVGFGSGVVLAVGRDRRWDVFGIERSALAVEQARENGFDHVVEGDFVTAPYAEGFFDVIVMSELIEHLPDPLPFLSAARKFLRPGGLLYLTTPNGAGLSGRVLSSDWTVVAPPEHLQLFSPESLRATLGRCGFADVTINTEGFNPYEMVRFFRHKVGGPQVAASSKHHSAALNETLGRNRWGTMMKSSANVVLRAFRLGDSLKAYAEKPRACS
jgi:SAM-dependent methyltransferase